MVASVTVPEPVFFIVKKYPTIPTAVGKVNVGLPLVTSTSELQLPTLPIVFATSVVFAVTALYSYVTSDCLTFAPE